jgi:hypothetical protein
MSCIREALTDSVDSYQSALARQVEIHHPQSQADSKNIYWHSFEINPCYAFQYANTRRPLSPSRNPARFRCLGTAVGNVGPLRNIGDRVEADSGIQGVYLVVLSFMSLDQICRANRPLSSAQTP